MHQNSAKNNFKVSTGLCNQRKGTFKLSALIKKGFDPMTFTRHDPLIIVKKYMATSIKRCANALI